MTRRAAQLTAISFFVVLFGQLGFKVAANSLGIAHPSWVFWAVLYGMVAFHEIRFVLPQPRGPLQPSGLDLLFVAGVLYAVVSFSFMGTGAPVRFAGILAAVWVGPYVLGRLLIRHIRRYAEATVAGIAAFTVVLIIWGVIQNPEVFLRDRLILFAARAWDGMGGDGTMAYIGAALGAACVALFARIQSMALKARLEPHFFAVFSAIGLLMVFLLWFGSRSSLVALFVSCVLLTLSLGKRNLLRNYGILLCLAGVLSLAYLFLPDARIQHIAQVGDSVADALTEQPATQHIAQVGNSISARIAMESEVVRMFLDRPLFGVGAGNFCGSVSEFGSPHSIQPQLLAEFGIIGGIPWTLLFLIVLFRLLKMSHDLGDDTDQSVLAVLSIWLFIVVVAQITGNIYIDFNVFMLTGAAVAIVDRRSPDRAAQTPAVAGEPLAQSSPNLVE